MKKEGSGSASRSRSESGPICQRHGSADPDPDPHQNIMNPQHWLVCWTQKYFPILNTAVQAPTPHQSDVEVLEKLEEVTDTLLSM
jgi:hypothetical protein